MKITALEEYGLRCMMALAREWPDKSVTMPELSTLEGLSIPYVGKLMMILKHAGLVKALRGRNGGYILAKPPGELRLNMVFGALGEPIYGSRHCRRYTGEEDICVHDEDCNVKHMWKAFNDFIEGVLNKLTLADLLDGQYKRVFESLKGEGREVSARETEAEDAIQNAENTTNDKGEIRTFK